MAAFEELKVGSLVRLLSGGPIMTVVERIDGLLEVRCSWFEGACERREVFPPDALEAASRADA